MVTHPVGGPVAVVATFDAAAGKELATLTHPAWKSVRVSPTRRRDDFFRALRSEGDALDSNEAYLQWYSTSPVDVQYRSK
ncbi:hypothetical protein PF005_g6147 [Phytophthora fragariae]|uniref:Uncharacterized protein n=1 Tax=Phytophthora fragariae TaxID=53985 RepID=A0A6A3ZWM4_9STRA|nr:hypothetical protein PF009_g6953 [Phytophthora fragariae]KAE9020870.1 hypothetical protein PF011_g5187 [Phytophthora fragariae]KAE9125056.1 hypothetical protein PF007_g6482 [Phytophthora fragariae]KAE9125598.1 hypothetical protein PF010_g5576 [Phytophthora fragariae]KAE9150008.1 hypothetical protein PF006_g5553 [Phytophthora fragariae]